MNMTNRAARPQCNTNHFARLCVVVAVACCCAVPALAQHTVPETADLTQIAFKGRAVSVGSSKRGDRPDEKALLSRVQFSF